jgi:glycerol-3-phosphate dehydrogenase (NAD(P)+)
MKVGIIGAGAWGTALAMTAARSGNDVIIWAHSKADEINQKRRNSWLPGVFISREIIATENIGDLSDADIWLVVTPTAFFSETMTKSRRYWRGQPIIICAKGIEPKSGKLLSEIISDKIPGADKYIGVLAGPQFAGEVAHAKPTGSTIAGSGKVRKAAHSALSALYLEDSNDVFGAQICGAGKNAVAMILGYLDGQGAGENERALKLTLAWQEIISFSRLFRAKTETFNKLCGIGDLFLTASSKTSRNYSAGFAIARGEKPTGTIEGAAALKWIIKTARKHKLNLSVLGEFAKNI